MRSLTRLIVAVALLGFAGCKQGEGERCQIDSDCEDGLTCAGDGFCRGEVVGPTIDARVEGPDAAPGAPDATPSTPDAAAPTVDASPPDAMP